METYLVGGAVRDELLGRPVRERDWVVVGATADELKAMGFRQVGRDFPVFLHPDTAEEYALARTERKTGAGHKGFTVHADPAVTLEEDLARRDLTINAMARAADGRLIDPFGGQEDLRAGLLRHVSPAFEEDPLRVFRVARFAAHLPGFRVAPETLGLMSRMAVSGSLTELSAERVWQELVRALEGEAPARFVEILRSCEALSPWFEEFRSTDPVPPGRLTDPVQRFAAYVSSLSEEQIEAMTRRLKAPNAYRQLATRVVRHRDTLARWRTVPAERLYQALQECGAFRSDAAFDAVLGVVEALEHQSLDALRETARRLRNEVNAEMFVGQGLSGKALGEALAAARIEALQRAQSSIRSRN